MPPCLLQAGIALVRELTLAGTLAHLDEVIRECKTLVAAHEAISRSPSSVTMGRVSVIPKPRATCPPRVFENKDQLARIEADRQTNARRMDVFQLWARAQDFWRREGLLNQRCDATLSIYKGFEALTFEVLADINASFYFGSESRQFLPELLILASLVAHPCRLAGQPAGADSLLGSASTRQPHFFVIPVLWRAISLSSRPAAFRSTAVRLMDAVVQNVNFVHDPEHHVLLHTSTGAMSELFGAHSTLLIDPRIVVLHLEGEGGDLRPGKHRSGRRTVVVPYFVEHRQQVLDALRERQLLRRPLQWTGEEAYTTAPRNTRVFMRCSDSKTSKGTPFRRAVVRVFAGLPRCDVTMINRRFSSLSRAAAVDSFLSTSSKLFDSVFCLVPLGITATSRRLYEAIGAGCVPVILSDKYALPFVRNGNIDAKWSQAVLRHSQANLESLPARLEALTDNDADGMRAAGREVHRQVRLRYSEVRAAIDCASDRCNYLSCR
ncbi:hypothetical protein AB1Y20_014963 [Prymnesium parvum]|uniref:Exostosin GT47 domain-containing protein n=1 Tax=Prymnesium parvum TaxID=97485 RepID=A0AB34JZ08_PRYPA